MSTGQLKPPPVHGMLQLSRWREHVPFSLALTLLGINLAAQQQPDPLAINARFLSLLAANMLAVTFAFMLNDLADAPDDARDPARGVRNAVVSGAITVRTGWLVTTGVGALALALYVPLTQTAFVTGLVTLILGVLYSWRGVRLKAWPVVDVLSHALMLSSLLFLAAYCAYHESPGDVWLVALGVGLVSAYGQLYNQIRDFEADRAARLRNTACFVGRTHTQRLMYACLGLAAVCLVTSAISASWPRWLVPVAVVALPVGLLLAPHDTDMRGTQPADLSGRAQAGLMTAVNLVMVLWLFSALLH